MSLRLIPMSDNSRSLRPSNSLRVRRSCFQRSNFFNMLFPFDFYYTIIYSNYLKRNQNPGIRGMTKSIASIINNLEMFFEKVFYCKQDVMDDTRCKPSVIHHIYSKVLSHKLKIYTSCLNIVLKLCFKHLNI